jgi:ribosomal protein L12E/L44/L45/RPP1/RPP2
MQFAGPLNPGDMAVRTNEVAPGVAALLKKESRNNRGIYELPVAKPENPDFYNMSLDNVQSQLRNFARTINTLAPEGESLAYINPKEAGILKLLGGAGEPEPVTGIPSFYTPGSSSLGGFGGYSKPRFKEDKPGGVRDVARSAVERNFNIPPSKPDRDDDDKPTSGPTGPADTQFQLNQAGLKAAIEEDRLSNLISSLGVDPNKKFTFGDETITSPGYNPIKAAEGIVDLLQEYEKDKTGKGKAAYDQAVDALKYSLSAYDYGGKDLFGNTMLGDDTKNILRAAKTFGQLPRDKNFVENVADLFGSVGISGILGKLFGSGKKLEDMTIEELKEFYDRQDAMMAAEEMRRRNRGGGNDNKQTPAPSQDTTKKEEDEEEEVDFFSNLQRRFNMPLTLESLRNRFMTGDPNRQNLLENLSDAVDRVKEENEAST